jgi:hypothetical protein
MKVSSDAAAANQPERSVPGTYQANPRAPPQQLPSEKFAAFNRGRVSLQTPSAEGPRPPVYEKSAAFDERAPNPPSSGTDVSEQDIEAFLAETRGPIHVYEPSEQRRFVRNYLGRRDQEISPLEEEMFNRERERERMHRIIERVKRQRTQGRSEEEEREDNDDDYSLDTMASLLPMRKQESSRNHDQPEKKNWTAHYNNTDGTYFYYNSRE